MNLLLIAHAPSHSAKVWLEQNDWEFEHIGQLPTRPRKQPPTAVLFFPKTETSLKEIERLKGLFPTSWIGLVLKPSMLSKQSQQQILAQSYELNSLWTKENWESFLFSSQGQIERHHAVQREIHDLQKQTRQLKSQVDQVSEHSKSLIDQLERDVVLATSIQRSLLPKIPPNLPGIQLSVKYLPSLGRGGDYYDVFEFGDKKRFGILLADSKTHKMAAALLSVLVKLRLEEFKERFPNSKSFLQHLNQEIQAVHQKDMASLNLLYGILDRATLTFQYTVAGKLRPLLWRLGEAPDLGTHVNPPLGGVDQFEFKESRLTLKPSDLLVFYTDGLEGPMEKDSLSVEERFIEVLKSRDLSPDPLDLQNEVMALVDRYQETTKLEDDFTLLQLLIDEKALYVASESK